MSYRRIPFAPEEHYHCYTRGIDGRVTFQDKQDYERFQEYLYLCNDTTSFDRGDFLKLAHSEIFSRPRKKELVAIGCYSLMPNHFHIGFQEVEEGGSSKFLQKLGTSYSMYFNAKYKRVGGLFIGPCRSRHIGNERYFRRVAQYIHLNAAELYEGKWKSGAVKNMRLLEKQVREYAFSSLRDYVGSPRPERAVLNPEMAALVRDGMPTLKMVLTEAREYYADLES
ncbi:hypothetical protein HY970_04220 [Candidatus Kaiserbacteria bacterium]|nr:hypothetical protein [Candidatus Kaiserbacteria bacterium]